MNEAIVDNRHRPRGATHDVYLLISLSKIGLESPQSFCRLGIQYT